MGTHYIIEATLSNKSELSDFFLYHENIKKL